MDIEKLLKSVPNARRRTPFYFSAFWLVLFPAIALWVGIDDGLAVNDTELLFDMLIFFALGIVAIPITFLVFRTTRRQARHALEKADYMLACISKLSYGQQEVIVSEVENKMNSTWRSKTYLLSGIATNPRFGESCLYGKVVMNKTFSVNQHVILPYQNIAEVVTNRPKSGKGEAARTVFNNISAAGSAISAVTGQGGVFSFIIKRPTIVVVDDAGNEYRIDCTDSDALVNELTKRINRLPASKQNQ